MGMVGSLDLAVVLFLLGLSAFEWFQVVQAVIMFVALVLAALLRDAVTRGSIAKEVRKLRADVDSLGNANHKFRNHTLYEILEKYETKEHTEVIYRESIRDREALHREISMLVSRVMDLGKP